MKIGVISDTHRSKKFIDKSIEYLKSCDLILHAGDNFVDSKYIHEKTGVDIIAVKGNCDYENVEEEFEIELEGRKIYLCHGHRCDVKNGIKKLEAKAKNIDADIVIFGHTHTPYKDIVDGILFLNPGSASTPRNVDYQSISILGLNGEKIDVKEIKL